MNLNNKKIGIWGFGVVGKSAANYLINKFISQKNTPEQTPIKNTNSQTDTLEQTLAQIQNLQIQILDKRELTEQEKAYLEKNNITFVNQANKEGFKKFLENNDLIIPSPGIDLREYKKYAHKFISEFDLFQQELNIPIIGITGTVGKTTITHILDQIIKHQGINIWTGGNIGTPVLDVINQTFSDTKIPHIDYTTHPFVLSSSAEPSSEDGRIEGSVNQPNIAKDVVPEKSKNTPNAPQLDLVLLELSSFQLELCKTFAPDLAVWTNFFPNHLDKHTDMQEYFMAKLQILTHQAPDQCALLPISLIDKLQPLFTEQVQEKQNITQKNHSVTMPMQISGKLHFFSENNPAQELINKLRPQDTLFYLDNNSVIKFTPSCTPMETELTPENITSPSPFALHALQSFNVGGSLSKGKETIGSIAQIEKLAEFTFRENLLIIFCSLYIFSEIANRTHALSDAPLLIPLRQSSYAKASDEIGYEGHELLHACPNKLVKKNHKLHQENINSTKNATTPSPFALSSSKAKLANPNTLNFAAIPPLACQVEHRLEKVASINNIDFYNDSKATTVTSTTAAVQKLASKNKPIILILGGLSKGVNRSTMISDIKQNVKLVISFGKEADILKDMCDKNNIPCQSFKSLEQASPDKASIWQITLDQAVKASFAAALPGDQILFSPSGSSYDLFKDYQERGRKFKEIVLELTGQNKGK